MTQGKHLLAWLCAALALTPLAHAQDDDIAAGRKLYEKECLACHGENTNADSGRWPPKLARYAAPGVRLSDAGGEALFDADRFAVAPPFGPQLHGIVGRPAGSVVGFTYSDAFLTNLKGMLWDEAALDRWLSSTQRWVPGVTMFYSQKDAEIRRKIIAYLKSNS